MKNNLTSRGRQYGLSKKLRVHHRVLEVRLEPCMCLWSMLRVVKHKIGRGPYLCRSPVMLMTTYKFFKLDAFYEMDGRKSPYIGEVLDWYRREDAGDLKRSELNELVENLTCLNALEGKIWKSNQKVVTDGKINPFTLFTLLLFFLLFTSFLTFYVEPHFCCRQ